MGTMALTAPTGPGLLIAIVNGWPVYGQAGSIVVVTAFEDSK